MLFRLVLLALHSNASGAEISETSNKLVKDEAVMMIQSRAGRGGLQALSLEEKKSVFSGSASTPSVWEPDQREESISRLMQSSTQLLKSGVTPDVASFANSTISTIEEEAVPAILEEHKASQQLLDKEFATFGEIKTRFKVVKDAITELEAKEQEAKKLHLECRTLQQEACNASNQCNTTLSELWEVVLKKEEILNITSGKIDRDFCPGTAPLSEDFYKANVVIFQEYIKRKQMAEHAWAEYNKLFPTCVKLTKEYHDKIDLCEQRQETLEEKSCKRTAKVDSSNKRFGLEWEAAEDTYKNTTRETMRMVRDRKAEYTGIFTVKCLLENIYNNSMSGEPCDEQTHPGKVKTQIDSCHHKFQNTDILTITAEPIPSIEYVKHLPYPCETRYLEWIGYKGLPPCAQAKICKACASAQPFVPTEALGQIKVNV